MERSKAVFWIVVVLASVFIVYWVGIRPPVEVPTRGTVDANSVPEPNASVDPNAPVDANAPDKPAEPNEPGKPADANAPADEKPADPNDPNAPAEPNEPSEPMESLNFKGVEMKNVMEKLARWTGKTIIPSEEAMKVKLTIYAPDKLPRERALAMIYSALKMHNIVAETTDYTIFLKSKEDAIIGKVPVLGADDALATIANREQIVQKFFQLEDYSAQEMASVIAPLVGENGNLTVDENAGSLSVIDTVSNLMRLERIIAQFDVPEAAPTVTRVFEIQHGGDPSEIVQMLNILLGQGGGRSTSRYDRDRYGGSSYGRRYYPSPNPQPVESSSSRKSSGSGATVVVGTNTGAIILIPEPRRNWIIARASAEDMERIAEWIDRLDKEEPIASEFEIVNLRYADPGEIEDSVGDGFRDLPGTQFLPSVLIEPLRQTKQVIIFGNKELREIVKKMIEEIDVPPGMFETRHFPLDYADPDQIKTMIEELFSQQGSSSSSYSPYSRYGGYSSYSRYGRSSSSSADEVKVISYATLKQVTVITSPERMLEVAKQIEEWDKPLDVDSVRPRIVELKNSDPIEMADLLKKLFSEETSSRTSIFDMIYGRGSESQSKIVGPLYGQLTFEDVPGTKKIIVISKIPEAYDVIEQLILDLDREEMGEIPEVIEIKYADVEDLSERLNAMFVEAGQSARIRLTTQGLSGSSAMVDSSSTGDNNNNNSSATDYTPPWSGSGARGRLDENMPISNVIGRIRFVPEPHTKSIMVLAPPEFMDEIRTLIDQLDVPGKQVMIQAIIVAIEHSNVTSLGVKFATDPAAFGALGENAVLALANVTNVGTSGTVSGGTISASRGVGATGAGTLLGVGTDVYALIDFLVKTTDARILNQQSLWTKDNEEASFFKGTMVPFLEGTTLLSTGGGSTQDVTFEDVGMELRARPSITPEDKVDMIVNVNLSQLTSDIINSQPVRDKMQTTTNMIIEDGQTLLLGGILFQKDSLVQTKVPGLGDIPGVGSLFRHKAIIKTNTEMLVFITPRVIDENSEDVSEATRAAIQGPQEKLDTIMGDLKTNLEGLDQ